MSADSPADIMAQHADYVSGGVRYCSCGLWEDGSKTAQVSRVMFMHHVIARLELYAYGIVGRP